MAFLRQPNIYEILDARHAASCNRDLRKKINAIRVDGATALEKLAHDIQLTLLLRFVKSHLTKNLTYTIVFNYTMFSVFLKTR